MELNIEVELEQLLREKATLEEELHRLEGQQKELDTRARSLCQKIIQELKNKTIVKKDVVSQLKAKVEELEAQLEKFSVHAALEKANAAAAESAENQETAEENDMIVVTELEKQPI
jgi:predicted nuclease with TOPRIM domain